MEELNAKPFLKWVGGKSQLIPQMEKYFPDDFKKKKITEYFEPFLGGGAVFFYVMQKYRKNIEKAYLYDVNEELILVYKVIKANVQELTQELEELDNKFRNLPDDKRSELFYEIRSSFNEQKKEINFTDSSSLWIHRAAQLIFLNKTCFNGLFRVNSKGGFNAPFGRYKNPRIYDKENLLKVSDVLKVAEIKLGDFELLEQDVKEKSFIYYDPPYRPISQTSSFVSYSKLSFNDEDQKRLATVYKKLDKKGTYQLLSNSDPRSLNPEDVFFETLYKGFNINSVMATRMINCDGTKRGKISELLITNY